MLETLITSKTRLRLLLKFFVNIANKGYLNSLANEFGESTNSVRKELNNLTNAGYLQYSNMNNKVVYKANISHPLFKELQSVVRRHLGLEQIAENIFLKIGSVKKIYILGDYAKGIDSGLIEVLIVGDNVDLKYLRDLEKKVEKLISRKVVFLVSSKETKLFSLLLFEE
tara:strand:+ start:103 stop:609 length:507 start_codon:yes stop_codon:yes gene_type:complete